MSGQHLLEIKGVWKSYQIKNRRIAVLKGIDLSVEKGEFLSIMGPSGSGKSTLLHIIGMLDRPDSGEYLFKGKSMLDLPDCQLSAHRSETIGFVFQTFNLIPGLNVLENVKLPFLYSSINFEKANKKAMKAIEQVGLSRRIDHRPSELSGGEMQRAAIARAIAIKPEIILADEPTGNLDSRTGEEILELLKALNDRTVSIIMITHDQQVASYARNHVVLKDGEIIEKYH